jgi:predicted enzyme related to lactoylglutathione lyase
MAEQASEMAGWALPREGSFCWTEIASNDADKCVAFYKEVFGWEFKGGDGSQTGMDYREFSTGGDRPVGGLYQIDPKSFGDNPPPHFMTYVAVDDVDENARLATELGATIIRGPMDIPDVGRMAIIQDPTGAMISTFTMKN